MSTTKYKVYNCTKLNLRTAPSATAPVGKVVSKGTKLLVVDGGAKKVTENGTTRTFYQIKDGSNTYYAQKKFLLEWTRAARTVRAAKSYSEVMLKNNWYYHNKSHKSANTFAKAKKGGKASSCGYFASWCAQAGGVIKKGTIISHTSAGTKPSSIGKVLTGKGNIKHGKIIFPVNKKISSYKSKLKPGDIILHDSSIEIYIGLVNGKPTVISGRNGSTLDSKGRYKKMKLTSGYEFTHNILAIIRPLG